MELVTTWVLVIFMWSGQGNALTNIPGYTKEECGRAVEIALEDRKGDINYYKQSMRFFCVPGPKKEK